MTDYRDPLYSRNPTYHAGYSAADIREAAPAWAVLIGAIALFGLLVYAFGGRDMPAPTNRANPPGMTNTAPPPAMPAPRTPAAPTTPPQ